MKKIVTSILLTAAITSGIINANGQETKPAVADAPGRFMIGITGGLSSPSGNFAKTDYDNNASGFAGSGANFGITGTWFITKNFGITTLVSYQQYSFQGIQNLADGFHESFDVDSASATAKGSNHSISVLVGPYYALPISHKFSVDFRVLGGLVSSTLAGWDIVLTDADITHPPLTQNTSTASAFGFQAGVGLHYNITNRWGVILNGDYFSSKPNFTIVNVDRNANAGREITSYNQPIAGFNTNLTLAYRFRK